MATAQFKPVDEQIAYLRKGAAEIIPEQELKQKLENSAKTGKPLRVYLGVDPTAPDIHLGHTVVLRKLKHFQDMGHTAIFLIGDFSAMIGDPTGQSETRPPLSREQVDANAKTYLAQVYKILDREKTEVRYNSEWLGAMSSYDVVRLCGHYRLARMLEREDFRSRLENNLPIAVHELLYPLLTAIDAVKLESDVEIGATEQKFNLLVHRDIQREYGLSGEVAFTMPILVGLDGERKMSKSLGNYVGITEPPAEMFGKIMSVSDELMWSYYELLTDFSSLAIIRLREEVRTAALHPMDAKMQLAHVIVRDFHDENAATNAQEEFQRVFRDRSAPTEIPEVNLTAGVRPLYMLLTETQLASSRTEAERLIKQGAVEVDGKVEKDVKRQVSLTLNDKLTQTDAIQLKVGKKKFLRVRGAYGERQRPETNLETLPHIKRVSRIKHAILQRYLPSWAAILGPANQRLNYFDCFAGPGRYEFQGEAVDGSPVIAVKTAKSFLESHPRHSLNILLTEKDEQHALQLKAHLEPLKPYPKNLNLDLLTEDSKAFIPQLLSKIPTLAPSFFMIDPYGHPLKVPAINDILSRPRTEALITLMWYRINMDLSNPAVQGNVDKLMGGPEWRAEPFLMQTGAARENGFLQYFCSHLSASYVLPFRIGYDPEDKMGGERTKYYLLHASNHPRAVLLMKEVMWPLGDEDGTFDFSGESQGVLISGTPRTDELRRILTRRFAGQELGFDDIRERTWRLPFIEKHYREVIQGLRKDGLVTVKAVSSKKTGLRGRDLVRFPEAADGSS